ncbi:uncharacterized protein LOC119657233 [Hermetia illucens]|uniref:uncharacterized protein LOC119657233 n=1 Tax=Hermetia illucens TaxID=343691 RepID=UPI0018CC06BB|nr:uncharacterized protein LOC119657233 [Hermetia illucens]XP_037919973.1 uncharacterized protein LOC119657233 [Hermetia illucens]XP_037919974.1 uncharacterized protein LOC119657233 [Hermetia illucens]
MFFKCVIRKLLRRTLPSKFKPKTIIKFIRNDISDNLAEGYLPEEKKYAITDVSRTIYYDCLPNVTMHDAISSAQMYHSGNVNKSPVKNIEGARPYRIRQCPNVRRTPFQMSKLEGSRAKVIPYRWKFNAGQLSPYQAGRRTSKIMSKIADITQKPKRIKLDNAAINIPLRQRSALIDSSYIGNWGQNRRRESYISPRHNVVHVGENGKRVDLNRLEMQSTQSLSAAAMGSKSTNLSSHSNGYIYDPYESDQGTRWASVPHFRDLHNEGYESPTISSLVANKQLTNPYSNKNKVKNNSLLHRKGNLMDEGYDKNWTEDSSSGSDSMYRTIFNPQENISAPSLQKDLKLKNNYSGDYMSHSLAYSHLNLSNPPCAGDTNSTQSFESDMSSDSSVRDSINASGNEDVNGDFGMLRSLKVWSYPKEFLESFNWVLPKSSGHKVVTSLKDYN